MDVGNIAIYKSSDGRVQLDTRFAEETIWLTQQMMVDLFQSSKSNISEHINRIFEEGELEPLSVVREIRTTAADGKKYETSYYNLDMVLSVGYRIKSIIATQFRQWATATLKAYLQQGYVLNQKRLLETKQQLIALKTAINIIERHNSLQINEETQPLYSFLKDFADGFNLLDDYDHALLDKTGQTNTLAVYIEPDEFLKLIKSMTQAFNKSKLFGLPKDKSFQSAIHQIYQTAGPRLLPTLEEKAAMLLYLIIKNHSFVDGNKSVLLLLVFCIFWNAMTFYTKIRSQSLITILCLH